jgi:acyl-CoA dehydrogenase
MGYIEETGVAQTLRDVRITTIYEGTTAIQANDLLGRKLGRDGGAAMNTLIAEADDEMRSLASDDNEPAVAAVLAATREALGQLRAATETLLVQMGAAPAAAYAVSVPYLKLCGIVFGGWLMARAAHISAQQQAAGEGDASFWRAKLQGARFYAAQTLPQALALARTVRSGGAAVADADAELL